MIELEALIDLYCPLCKTKIKNIKCCSMENEISSYGFMKSRHSYDFSGYCEKCGTELDLGFVTNTPLDLMFMTLKKVEELNELEEPIDYTQNREINYEE